MRRYMPYILDGMVYFTLVVVSVVQVESLILVILPSGPEVCGPPRFWGWPVVQPKLSVDLSNNLYTGGAFFQCRRVFLIRHTWQNGLGVPGLVSEYSMVMCLLLP